MSPNPETATGGRTSRVVALIGGRALIFTVLAALSVFFYQRIPAAATLLSANADGFQWLLVGITVIAVSATWLVLASRQSASATSGWIELGVIIVAGLVFRALLFGQPPVLSHDAYRYAWDAQLISHGVSPWTHIVTDPSLASLRDTSIWPLVNWRDAVTIYPPAAQLLFLLVHIIAPLNIYAVKAAMTLCDVGVGVLGMLLLRQRGLDPRRIIVYWWNPIPILEFTYSGHVDAAAALWTVAAVLVATRHWRGARVAAGALLALAVATKLYPILFVVVLVRRRDWGFLAGLFGALALLYIPFLPLGVLSGGFLGTYFSQRFVDQGIIFRLITTLIVSAPLQFLLQGLALVSLCALTLWLRLRRGLQATAGILLISVAWIAVSPHIFPWYVGALLPFLALYLRLPNVFAVVSAARDLASTSSFLVFGLWLFVLALPFSYILFASGHDANLFPLIFIGPLAVALLPLLSILLHPRRLRAATVSIRPSIALARLFGGAKLEE